jgi:hypothetical protein
MAMAPAVFTDLIGGLPLTPEWLLGRASGGGDCPVCGEVIASWARDERGALIDHAGRVYPCRFRARWEPEWTAERYAAYLETTDIWGAS